MLRVPNVPQSSEAEQPAGEAPSTLPRPSGEPTPVKPYTPDDPTAGDLQKPGSAPDVVPLPGGDARLPTF